MGTDGVVFLQPLLSDFPDLGQAVEQIKAEHLLAVGAVEALDVSVLSWTTRFDEIQHDVMNLGPGF